MIKKFVKGKTLVLIDNANMIHALGTLGWRVSFKKMKEYFEKNLNLTGIYFYSAYSALNRRQQIFLEMLSRWGYILRTKEVKIINTKEGKEFKGDLDVEIAIDVFEFLPRFQTIVLLSGDSDFAPLVEWLKAKGKKTVVISTRPHISRELVRSADKFLDLGKFRRYWELKEA